MAGVEEKTKDRTSIAKSVAKEDIPDPTDLPDLQGRAGSKFTTTRIELWAFYVYYIVSVFPIDIIVFLNTRWNF